MADGFVYTFAANTPPIGRDKTLVSKSTKNEEKVSNFGEGPYPINDQRVEGVVGIRWRRHPDDKGLTFTCRQTEYTVLIERAGPLAPLITEVREAAIEVNGKGEGTTEG